MSQVIVPGLFTRQPQNPAQATFISLDSAGEQAAGIFEIPYSGNIISLGLWIGYITSRQPIQFSLQNIDPTTGYPDGTYYKGSAPGVIASPSANSYNEVTLATQATSAVRADRVAAVVEFVSTAGNIRIMMTGGSSGPWFYNQFVANKVNGSWSRSTAYAMQFIVKYSDGTYQFIPGVHAAGLVATMPSYDSADSPDEVGNRFVAPFSFYLSGFLVRSSMSADTSTHNLCYYSGTSLVASISVNPLIDGGRINGGWRAYLLAQDYLVTKDDVIRLTAKATGAGNVNLTGYLFDSEAIAQQDGFTAAQCQQTERTDEGAFTDTPTKRVLLFPMIKGVEISGGTTVQKSYSFL